MSQEPLAHITKCIHNVESSHYSSDHSNQKSKGSTQASSCLRPPIPVCQTESNWPLLTVSRGFFDGSLSSKNQNQVNALLAPQENISISEGWGSEEDDIAINEADSNFKVDKNITDSLNMSSGWDVEEVDLPIEMISNDSAQSTANYYSPPSKGISSPQLWIVDSCLAIDHVLAGSFETAFQLLHEQIGVVKFERYKKLFFSIYSCSKTSLTLLPSFITLNNYPSRNWKEKSSKLHLPATVLQLSDLVDKLQTSYQLTTAGKFNEAIEKLQSILIMIPLLCLESKQSVAEAQQLIEICREYILGLKMETARKIHPKVTIQDQQRVCEMIAYFTHCNLQPIHQILTLRTAVNTFFKFKNYKTARSFARRLLELGPRPEIAQQMRKILQVSNEIMIHGIYDSDTMIPQLYIILYTINESFFLNVTPPAKFFFNIKIF